MQSTVKKPLGNFFLKMNENGFKICNPNFRSKCI